jgi:uncharacterized protein (DUF1810 family)
VTDPYNLQRFIEAQADTFEAALSELHAGRKQTHWMWFIFPQLAALGRSTTARFYGISSLAEARTYLEQTLLGPRLRQCSEALLPWRGSRSAEEILGPIDAMKLRSSMTLFEAASGDALFGQLLNGFYSGDRDDRTLALLNAPD